MARLLVPKFDASLPSATRIVLRTRTSTGAEGRFQVTASLDGPGLPKE